MILSKPTDPAEFSRGFWLKRLGRAVSKAVDPVQTDEPISARETAFPYFERVSLSLAERQKLADKACFSLSGDCEALGYHDDIQPLLHYLKTQRDLKRQAGAP